MISSPCCQCFLCIGNNHLSCRRNSHAISVADEDRKSDLILKVFDLLAERWLSEKEALRGSREVSCLSNSHDVLQMPELHEI